MSSCAEVRIVTDVILPKILTLRVRDSCAIVTLTKKGSEAVVGGWPVTTGTLVPIPALKSVFLETERHRSRTCLASGYDAVLVLKTSWGTSPGRSDAQGNSA